VDKGCVKIEHAPLFYRCLSTGGYTQSLCLVLAVRSTGETKDYCPPKSRQHAIGRALQPSGINDLFKSRQRVSLKDS